MKILKQYKGEEAKVSQYIRSDMQPVEGAVDDVKWYIVEETEHPEINQFERIETEHELTEDPNKKHPYFFRAIEKHAIKRIPDNSIVQMLNESLGQWLDSNYLIPTQIKHLYELQTNKASADKKQNIESLTAWQEQCRTLRDQREFELINNGVLPELTWPNPPTVLKSTKI